MVLLWETMTLIGMIFFPVKAHMIMKGFVHKKTHFMRGHFYYNLLGPEVSNLT